jgi:hypothetical protein
MGRKIVILLIVSALTLAAAVVFTNTPAATAGKGGCPNDAATKGAAHANVKSAHGSAKQTERGCQVAEPTPEPTPTPAPTTGADVRVTDVTVSAPESALPREDFLVLVLAGLRNDGPEGKVLVDTTFTFVSPPDCSVSPAIPITVPDRWLEDSRVSIARSWLVSCIEPGPHTFTADVTVALDPTEPVADPDTANNSGSGNDTTEIGS